jgi:gliding motility-associated-like protein
LSTDFNTVFSVFNYPTATVPRFFDVRMEAFEDDIPVDGLLGFCNSGPACTYTAASTCCGVFLFGVCVGLNENDDRPCFADPFRNSMDYRLGKPCEWFDHGYVTYAGSGCANDNYIPRIQTYWRYTKGTACNDAIDLGSLTSGLQLTHSNSNICYSNNFPNSGGNDVFYQFSISQAMGIKVSLCGANGAQFDSYLYLLDSGCNVIASDDNGCGSQSVVSKNLCQTGTYYIVVDGVSANEQGTFTLLVEEDPSFTFSATINKTDVTCTGANDGKAKVTVSGGLPPYSYLWSTGAIIDSVNSLLPGVYSVTINDADGCSISASTTITEPLPLSISISTSDVTCSGANDGSATANVSGGTSPFSYQWNTIPQQTSATAIFLSAGTFAVVVTDANNCTSTSSATINTSSVIIPAIDLQKNVSCFGLNDGEILLTTSGGVQPYTFVWSNGAVSEDISNLAPGNYVLTVTDADNCFVTKSFDISEPSLLQASVENIYPVTCFGYSNGSVTISVNGGTLNYSYTWSNNSIFQDLINVAAGSYDLTVTDANNCTATLNVSVTEPTVLNVVLNPTDPTCFGISNGLINSTTSGGTPPYSYIWSTGDITSDINSIPAGNYSVLVTDANNCFVLETVALSTGPELMVTSSVNDVLCNGDASGVVSVNIAGGTSPYNFTWSDGSSGASLNNVTAGNYSFTVVDADGCMSISDVIVNEPDALSINLLTLDILCSGNNDGMAFAVASGGIQPYDYSWNIPNSQNTNVLAGLSVGNYVVTVADANNCSVINNFSITEGTALDASVIDVWAPTCYGGQDGGVELTATGGLPPYEYAVFTNIFQGNIFNDLESGQYGALILDSNGCSDTVQFTVPEPVEFSVSLPYKAIMVTGSVITLEPTFAGTDSVVSWSWNPSESLSCFQCQNPEASPVYDISYTVTAIDVNGCIDTATIIVIVKQDYEIYTPNVFSPNGDNVNDVYKALDFGASRIFEIKIFDKWGELIFQSNNIKQGWDGTFQNKLLDVGVYTFYITGEFLNTEPFEKTGSITLIR